MSGGRIITVFAALLISFSLHARDRVPVGDALNSSLKERDQLQKTYRPESRADDTVTAPTQGRRIKLDVGDSFGPSGGGGTDGATEESLAFHGDRLETTDLSSHLEAEMENEDPAPPAPAAVAKKSASERRGNTATKHSKRKK